MTSLQIQLNKAGKRFNTDWIFKDVTYSFDSTEAYVILGSNGSGKSTLLRCISSYAPLSSGSLSYFNGATKLAPQYYYRSVSFCSPYLELYEELTVNELVRFHFSLKSPLPKIAQADIPALAKLETATNRPVKYLSSGMKQRLRLALALYSHTSVVLLDEPLSNLDAQGISWYKELVENTRKNRLFIVASNNQADEFFFCTKKLNIGDFKP